jgi:hypothetical protein
MTAGLSQPEVLKDMGKGQLFPIWDAYPVRVL